MHMEILRSPLAHARITKIDASRAWDIPGVAPGVTGTDGDPQPGLAAQLSYDTQAVLATDKVRFRARTVACVIADDPYIAKRRLRGDRPSSTEPLRSWSTRRRGREDAPVIRDDKETRTASLIYNWGSRGRRGHRPGLRGGGLVSRLQLHYPRSHPSPIECCGSIADFNRSTSKLTVYMTTQAPHHHPRRGRAGRRAARAHDPIISPDIGGGSATRWPIYPGYVCSILASILLERPVKWESRTRRGT